MDKTITLKNFHINTTTTVPTGFLNNISLLSEGLGNEVAIIGLTDLENLYSVAKTKSNGLVAPYQVK